MKSEKVPELIKSCDNGGDINSDKDRWKTGKNYLISKNKGQVFDALDTATQRPG